MTESMQDLLPPEALGRAIYDVIGEKVDLSTVDGRAHAGELVARVLSDDAHADQLCRRLEMYIDAPAAERVPRAAPTALRGLIEPVASNADEFASDLPTRSRLSQIKDKLEDVAEEARRAYARPVVTVESPALLGFEEERFVPLHSSADSLVVADFIASSRQSINSLGNRAKSRLRSLITQTWLDPVFAKVRTAAPNRGSIEITCGTANYDVSYLLGSEVVYLVVADESHATVLHRKVELGQEQPRVFSQELLRAFSGKLEIADAALWSLGSVVKDVGT